jgi:hypothetical protein
MEQSKYEALANISVKSYVEKKGGMDYLSWATAWHLLKQQAPDAQRTVYESEHTGLNYFTDGSTAYVKVGITVDGLEHIDYLPIMDYKNKSIPVDKVTAFDVNKTIQRSTAKAIAMHGLGLSLWTGEDTATTAPAAQPEPEKPKELISLRVNDDNWDKVIKYVAANKELGIDKIVENLSVKYKVAPMTKKKLAEQL